MLKHIDAYLYVDRRSGRWELRLIRADYDPDTLPVFDETNVVDWGELGRREAADLVNSVTVRFTDVRTDRTGSVSVTDTAQVQLMGQVVGATVDYSGIRFESLAVRVAERDLRALSAPILTGEITVNRIGAGLEPGDVIRLVSPTRGLEGIVVRVVEMDHGDGRANGIRLKIAEDVFALGETALVGGDTGDPGDLIVPPQPLARRWVAEAPYWLLVQELGHAQADALPQRGSGRRGAGRRGRAPVLRCAFGAGLDRCRSGLCARRRRPSSCPLQSSPPTSPTTRPSAICRSATGPDSRTSQSARSPRSATSSSASMALRQTR